MKLYVETDAILSDRPFLDIVNKYNANHTIKTEPEKLNSFYVETVYTGANGFTLVLTDFDVGNHAAKARLADFMLEIMGAGFIVKKLSP